MQSLSSLNAFPSLTLCLEIRSRHSSQVACSQRNLGTREQLLRSGELGRDPLSWVKSVKPLRERLSARILVFTLKQNSRKNRTDPITFQQDRIWVWDITLLPKEPPRKVQQPTWCGNNRGGRSRGRAGLTGEGGGPHVTVSLCQNRPKRDQHWRLEVSSQRSRAPYHPYPGWGASGRGREERLGCAWVTAYRAEIANSKKWLNLATFKCGGD